MEWLRELNESRRPPKPEPSAWAEDSIGPLGSRTSVRRTGRGLVASFDATGSAEELERLLPGEEEQEEGKVLGFGNRHKKQDKQGK